MTNRMALMAFECGYGVEPDARAQQAEIDKAVDYSDEVTTEQLARIERAYKHIDKSRLRSKTGPAW